MKKIWTILSVLLLAGVMVSCDSDKDDNVINDEPRVVNMLFPPQRIELTDAQRAYVGANNEFALNLFRHLCEASGTQSLFCSPLSVTSPMLSAGVIIVRSTPITTRVYGVLA